MDVMPDSRKVCYHAERREGGTLPLDKRVSALPESEFVRRFGGPVLTVMARAGYFC
jgi:hypothetical protein